jgi:D-alanine-D-alanine ligase-like ATP-grasp enzyme/acylphosphatase/L-alanine-DL-glutamate epimerase-like enolase superfamily enzyme
MNDQREDNSSPLQTGELRITQSRAFSYRAPRPQGPAATNYVVELTAESADGREIVSYGEGHPRWAQTGDDAGSSWKFLVEAVRQLEGRVLAGPDREGALHTVRVMMRNMSSLANEHSVDEEHLQPFRGTSLGIEVSLLDLFAQHLDMTLAGLLGKQRDSVPQVPETPVKVGDILEGDVADFSEIGQTVSIKFRGSLERESAQSVLRSLCGAVERGKGLTLWIDAGSALSVASSEQLTSNIIAAFRFSSGQRSVFISQPFRSKSPRKLRALQNHIDEQLGEISHLSVQVVADNNAWDVSGLREQLEAGGVGAVRVRPAQSGGLLPALDLVEVASAAGVGVCLSGMGDESRLGASAEHHLALALPKINLAEIGASVEQSLPLTETAGETRNVDTDPLAGMRATSQDSSLSENPEEADAIDDDEEGDFDDEGIPYYTEDAAIAHLEASGVPGLGVGVSFISLVNDVEKMQTFPEPPPPEFEGMHPNVFDDIDDLHPLGARGSKGHLAEREALALGLATTRYSKGVFLATDGHHEPINFKWNRNPLVSGVALGLCTHKEATRLQLQRAGVPVPQGRTFERGDLESARLFAGRIGYPVVMKPAMGVRGIGVVANIQNEQELNEAHDLMTGTRLGDQDFIVEKHVNGKDYRIVVVGERVVAAILREPASVVGDGRHSVAELLLNRNSARRRNPHLWARPPQYNAAAKYELQKQNFHIDSVPDAGQVVRLGSTNSLSQGGESIAVLDEMHPSILEACLKVMRSVPGMDYCGVDFLLEDHTKPLDEQDAGICELNAHAAIGNSQYPMFGTPRPVARIVMYEVARRFGLQVAAEPAENVALRVLVRGKISGVGFHRWLRRRALEAGVEGWVRSLDDKRIEAILVGPTNSTTGVVSSLINGPRRARPTSYVAEHIDKPAVEGFEIRPDRAGIEQLRVKTGRQIRRVLNWRRTDGR